jgi:hypothetical protein
MLVVAYAVWPFQLIKEKPPKPQSSESSWTPERSKDVIGDLGGIKVKIPIYCADYIEYDRDPNFGEPHKASAPERTYESRLRSFGIDVLLPTMTCLENAHLREHRREHFLQPDNPWISISINSGEIYPKAGPMATDRVAKSITNTLDKPTQFWFANYERLPDLIYGLDAYVVTGVNPKTGQPAKQDDQTDDIFIEHINPGDAKPSVAKTYIACGKTNVPGGVASCSMAFDLEPQAEVYVNVRFTKSRLAQWREIRKAVVSFLMGFEKII